MVSFDFGIVSTSSAVWPKSSWFEKQQTVFGKTNLFDAINDKTVLNETVN